MTARTETLRRRAAEDLTPLPIVVVHRPRVRSWIVFALAVVIAFFGLIFSRTSLDRSAFVLEDLEQQITEQEARLGDLRVEVARLRAPERISQIAADMGLVYPAERISIQAPSSGRFEQSPEYQWAQLRSAPAAHP
jgi:cell division protein FtsL